ncbi:MAG: NUDIX hydrolase [Clostridia bacterium]|nr:NUDIX hydrolase [Clostridia bacterium]
MAREIVDDGYSKRTRAFARDGVDPETGEEICAGGVVCYQGKIVALRRKNGVWLMPKGHVDPGETLEEAARREVKEETGLSVCLGPKLGETAYSFVEGGKRHKKRVHWFYMEARGGELQPEEEMFTAVRLLNGDELDVLSFPADREIAERALVVKACKEG